MGAGEMQATAKAYASVLNGWVIPQNAQGE